MLLKNAPAVAGMVKRKGMYFRKRLENSRGVHQRDEPSILADGKGAESEARGGEGRTDSFGRSEKIRALGVGGRAKSSKRTKTKECSRRKNS